jgi:hypothetical protein
MQKIMISLPDDLARRMRAVFPNRKRSRIIAELLKEEINRREQMLYDCACEVEEDDVLNSEMSDWNITTGDGIEPETW